MQKYDSHLENMMISYYNSLGERDKRHYAGLEALKLGFGGQKYIYTLFQMSKNTLRRGISELQSGKNIDATLGNRQRRVGGGRKNFFCPKKDMQCP